MTELRPTQGGRGMHGFNKYVVLPWGRKRRVACLGSWRTPLINETLQTSMVHSEAYIVRLQIRYIIWSTRNVVVTIYYF